MDGDIIASLHLAVTDNILSSMLKLQLISKRNLGYFYKLIWSQVIAQQNILEKKTLHSLDVRINFGDWTHQHPKNSIFLTISYKT